MSSNKVHSDQGRQPKQELLRWSRRQNEIHFAMDLNTSSLLLESDSADRAYQLKILSQFHFSLFGILCLSLWQ